MKVALSIKALPPGRELSIDEQRATVWEEVGSTKNFVHSTLLRKCGIVQEGDSFSIVPYDRRYSWCQDEIVCVSTLVSSSHYYISRASAMKSALLRMLMGRGEELILSSLNDEILRRCLQVLFGEVVLSTQLKKCHAMYFFPDEIPINYIDFYPSEDRLEKMFKFLFPTSLIVGDKAWYVVLYCHLHFRVVPMKMLKMCSENLQRLLSIFIDPIEITDEVLSDLCIKQLSYDECLKLQLLSMSRMFGMKLSQIENEEQAYRFFKWAYTPRGWARRDRPYANRELIPNVQDCERYPMAERIPLFQERLNAECTTSLSFSVSTSVLEEERSR